MSGADALAIQQKTYTASKDSLTGTSNNASLNRNQQSTTQAGAATFGGGAENVAKTTEGNHSKPTDNALQQALNPDAFYNDKTNASSHRTRTSGEGNRKSAYNQNKALFEQKQANIGDLLLQKGDSRISSEIANIYKTPTDKTRTGIPLKAQENSVFTSFIATTAKPNAKKSIDDLKHPLSTEEQETEEGREGFISYTLGKVKSTLDKTGQQLQYLS